VAKIEELALKMGDKICGLESGAILHFQGIACILLGLQVCDN